MELARKNHANKTGLSQVEQASSDRRSGSIMYSGSFFTIHPRVSCPCGGGCPKCTPFQAKLQVGEPDDEYEKEADQVAEQVMRMPDPVLQRNKCLLKGDPSCREDEEEKPKVQALMKKGKPGKSGRIIRISIPVIQRKCPKYKTDEEKQKIQRKISSRFRKDIIQQNVPDVIRSPGQPLDLGIREFFEPRFGQNFSDVRVHTGIRAAESAQSVNARAFTVGRNIVFGAEQYLPHTSEGKYLLAHELTHVVQQSGFNVNSGNDFRVPPNIGAVCLRPEGAKNNAAFSSKMPELQDKAEFDPLEVDSKDHPGIPGTVGNLPSNDGVKLEIPENITSSSPGVELVETGNHKENDGTDVIANEQITSAPSSPLSVLAMEQVGLISADSLRSEAQVMQIASGHRKQVSSHFSGILQEITNFINMSGDDVLMFIATKRSELTGASASVLKSVQGLITNILKTAEVQGNKVRNGVYGIVQSATASIQNRVQGITSQIINTISTISLPDIPGITQIRGIIANILKLTVSEVTGGLNRVIGFIDLSLNTGMSLISTILNTVRILVNEALSYASNAIQRILQTAFQFLNRIVGMIISLLQKMLNGTIVPMIKRLEASINQTVGKGQQYAISAIRTNRKQHLEALGYMKNQKTSSTEANTVNEPQKTLQQLGMGVIYYNQIIVQLFRERTSDIISSIFQVLNVAVGQFFKQISTSVVRVVRMTGGIISEVIASFYQVSQVVGDFMSTMITTCINGLIGITRYMSSLIQGPVDQLLQFAQKVLGRIRNTVSNLVQNFINSGGDLLSGTLEAIGSFDITNGPIIQSNLLGGALSLSSLGPIKWIVGVVIALVAAPFLLPVIVAELLIIIFTIIGAISTISSLLLIGLMLLVLYKILKSKSECSPSQPPSPTPEPSSPWAINGVLATALIDKASLSDLARRVNDDPLDWPCIWIEKMQSPYSGGKIDCDLIKSGDIFNISNLKDATKRADVILNFSGKTNNFLLAVTKLYPGIPVSHVDEQISDLSEFGGNPIQSLTITGHCGGETVMWGEGGEKYNFINLLNVVEDAKAKMGPRRCWFTHDAKVRIVGCKTESVASYIAEIYLRRDKTVAIGTNSTIFGDIDENSNFFLHLETFGFSNYYRYYNANDFNSAKNIWSSKRGSL